MLTDTKKHKTEKELVKTLRKTEETLRALASQISEICCKYEEPEMIAEVKRLKALGKARNVTTSWLQKTFQIGYARAASLIDELRKQEIVK